MRPRPQLQPTRPLLRLVAESASSQRLASHEETVVALLIERGDAWAGAFEFNSEEQHGWLQHAALEDLCLLVIAAEDALEIYTTDRDRLAAFRPVVASLKARLTSQPMAGKTPTKELTGRAAAERLLSRAAGLVRTGAGGNEATVRAAATLAAAFGTLGSTLGTLCWAAATVTQRVREETGALAVRDPVDELAAERVVEEELARWRSELAKLRRSLPPGASQEPADKFHADEPGSLIRVKVPQALLGLSATSEHKRRA